MDRQTERKIILVVRRTRLDELIARYNTMDQARFYIERLGSDFSDYMREDAEYKKSATRAEALLRSLGRVQVLQREYLSNFIFGDADTVVCLGQDGLVANTLKYLDRQVVLGVNPDPGRWDGALLPFAVDDLEKIVPEVFKGGRDIATVTMAKATLGDGQSLYAVNDLFIGASSHVSARYAVSVGGKSEKQSSSGVIVSTGLGSTGWLKSVIAGAAGVASAVANIKVDTATLGQTAWDAEYLTYCVREPFPSNTTGVSIVHGRITKDQPMMVESHMAGIGVIFSDGIERDFLEFNSGMKATITVADKFGRLVV